MRIQNIITDAQLTTHSPTSVGSVTSDALKVTARRLSRLELGMNGTDNGLDALTDDVDSSLLEQYVEQLADHKRELSTVHEELISLDLENDHELVLKQITLEKLQQEIDV